MRVAGVALPMFIDDGFVEILPSRVARHEELSLPGSIAARGTDEGKVGALGFAHFGHLCLQTRGQRLTFGDLFSRVSEHFAEHMYHPCTLAAGNYGVNPSRC